MRRALIGIVDRTRAARLTRPTPSTFASCVLHGDDRVVTGGKVLESQLEIRFGSGDALCPLDCGGGAATQPAAADLLVSMASVAPHCRVIWGSVAMSTFP